LFFAILPHRRCRRRSRSLRGFSLLSSLVAVGILGTIGVGFPILVSSNQDLRTTTLHSGQAYYASRASFEYGLRQIQVEGDPDSISPRNFLGENFSINRTGGRIVVVGTTGNANNSFSITDPNPPSQANCLTVNTTNAVVVSEWLDQIYASHATNCTDPITIESLVVSWDFVGDDDDDYELDQIYFDANSVYQNPNLPTGSTFNFIAPFDLGVPNSYQLRMKWDDDMDDDDDGVDFTIVFNMEDNSSKTVVFTVDNDDDDDDDD